MMIKDQRTNKFTSISCKIIYLITRKVFVFLLNFRYLLFHTLLFGLDKQGARNFKNPTICHQKKITLQGVSSPVCLSAYNETMQDFSIK